MSRKARKFKGFFCPKSGDLKKKKKKVFAKIQSDFSAEIRNLKVFSAQNRVISKKKKKKKKVFAKIQSDFSAEIRNSKVFSAQNQKPKNFSELTQISCRKPDAQLTKGGGGHASILLTLLCNFAILATQS